MKKLHIVLVVLVLPFIFINKPQAQDEINASMYDIPPRWLVDLPTAGTLPRGYYNIGFRFYTGGGAIANTDIGLSSRLMMGISYGAEKVISNDSPDWNPRLEFSLKFRLVDEMEYFPAITVGYSSQGNGAYSETYDRFTFKSRGFFGVVSRSFYFYQWTSGWHFGVNYSLEKDVDGDKTVNFFGGFDATFNYNLALIAEYDLALNDDRSTLPNGQPNVFGGKGRGYLNFGVKWLFTENLEMEAIIKDVLINRKESETVTREIRINYIDKF
ncbi:hypothetical protein ACFLQG_00335 [Candidatus Zixiibacteriota bacterium]